MSSLHVETVGTGTPVLALPGLGCDLRLMSGLLEPVFARVPDHRRIYVDLPGSGHSPATDLASTAEVVAAVEAVVDVEIGDDRFLVVGESFGGYVAREVARRRRSRVAGLALVCPVGEPVAARRQLPEHVVAVRDDAAVAALPAELRAEFEPYAVVQTAAAIERFRTDIAPGLPAADEAFAERLHAGGYPLPHAPEADGPFAAPTLLVAARQDSVVGYLDQWALLPHYPRATYAVLDAAGHNAHLERPALVEELLVDWLERVRTT